MNIFNNNYKKYDRWYDKYKFAFLSELEAIKKVLPKEGKGLEIGVGTGRFASALGIRQGVDPSENMIQMARTRGVRVKVAFGENLPFKKGAFDYAVIITTLCLVRDPKVVLYEAKRVLRKEGIIILGIIDRESFLGKYYQDKKSVFFKPAEFFSPGEVIHLLKETGYTQLSHYQTLFKLPGEINTIETPQKGFGKGGFCVIAGKKDEK